MFRILSLDGGGTWALLQVRALQQLFGEHALGRKVLACFDLAVANSGGSIVLGALVADFPLSKILTLFCDEDLRESIFVRHGGVDRMKEGIAGVVDFPVPKYNAAAKLDGLRAVLRDSSLGADVKLSELSALKFVIMGFDYDTRRALFFRSYESKAAAGAKKCADITLAEAMHASSNAPVRYFDKPADVRFGGFARRCWDGAIGGYNNPVLAGVVEALANSFASLDDLRILSIGTGSARQPHAALSSALAPPKVAVEDERLLAKRQTPSIIGDIGKLATAVLDDPPDAASYMAYVLLDGRRARDGAPRYVRLSPSIQPVFDRSTSTLRFPQPYAKDDASRKRFVDLSEMEMDAVEKEKVELINELGNYWLNGQVPNQAVRANGETLEVDIGHATAAEAITAWKTTSGLRSRQ